jgi:hypothetical protein
MPRKRGEVWIQSDGFLLFKKTARGVGNAAAAAAAVRRGHLEMLRWRRRIEFPKCFHTQIPELKPSFCSDIFLKASLGPLEAWTCHGRVTDVSETRSASSVLVGGTACCNNS